MSRKLTTVEFIWRAEEIHGNKYDYTKSNYTMAKNKIKIICPIHGEFEQKASNHINLKQGCPKCSIINIANQKRDNNKIFIKKAKEVHGDKYDYSKAVYKNNSTKVKIICPIHGEFTMEPKNHTNANQGCPKCANLIRAKKISLSKDDFVKKAIKVHGDKYDYSLVEYKNAHTKIKIICPIHGEFEQRPGDHLNNGRGCPKCGTESMKIKQSLTTKEFIMRSKETHGNKYDYSLVEYSGIFKKIKIICPIHGEFEQLSCNHLNGSGCPKCAGLGPSKPEIEIYDFIKSIYHSTVIQSDRSILAPKELDIYIPELKIAFEINGEYWHNANQKPKNYHVKKTDECAALGIRLYHIWTNTDFEIWKSKISIMLNMVKTRIFARKCKIYPITTNVYSSFCNDNHLQGGCTSKVKYGLYMDNTLVSVMGFSKPRFNKKIEWELIRFCTLKNTIVVGGFSKLLKRFKTDYDPDSIISYANRDFSHGDIYGNYMELVGATEPNYKWIGNGEEIPRYKAQKHKLSSLLGDSFIQEESEKENMIRNGYIQCFDSGNFKFVWNKQTS